MPWMELCVRNSRLPLHLALAVLALAALPAGEAPPLEQHEPGAIVMLATGGPGVEQTGIDPAKAKKGKTPTAVELNARGEGDAPLRSVAFTPPLPAAGHYEIWIRLPAIYWPMAAKGMGVEITPGDGEMEVLQARPMLGGPWTFFGTWRLVPGKARVVVSNEGVSGLAAVEAVKFVPAQAPPQRRGARPLPAPKDDFERMRDRWLDITTGPADLDEDDAEVREMFRAGDHLAMTLWTTMVRTPERKRLWDDMNPPSNNYSSGGREADESFDRLRRMALAYAGAAPHYGFGGRMRGNPQLKADILDGLDFMLKTSWNEQTQYAAMGWLAVTAFIPRYSAEILLALGDVPDALRQRVLATSLRLSPTPITYTGANRLFMVTAHVCMAIVGKDRARLDLARQGMDDPLAFTSRSTSDKAKAKSRDRFDGMYRDGSFIQHLDQPYNHGYGTGMVKNLCDAIALFEGSPWQVTDAQKANLVQYVRTGVIPLSFRGVWFRRVTGRAVSAYKDERPTIESNLTSVIPIAPPADRARFLGVLKAMQEYGPAKDYAAEAAARARRGFGRKPPAIDFLRKQAALLVKRDATIKPAPWWTGSQVCHNMDLVAHQRPAWAAELVMSSTRIATHESFYGNNKKGWYLGDGMLRLHTLDYRLYLDNYWPTHDPYRLPGTTVDTRDRAKDFGEGAADYAIASTSDFAGGAALADRWSVAGMELHGRESSLKARKAWIMLDDAIICLGSGITAKDGRPIETTIEQMKLAGKGDNPLTVDGKAQDLAMGASATLAAPRWLHLAGNTADAGLGCWFPTPSPVQAKREQRTGAWTDIGPASKNDATAYTRPYATLWFDHGADPADAGYQYVLLPALDAKATAAWAAKPPVEILACTPQVSAARDARHGLTAAVFWEDAPASAGVIACDKRACVILSESATEIRVAVSDPTHKAKSLTVTVALPAGKVVSTDAKVTVQTGGKITLSIDTTAADGRAFETVVAR